MKNDGRMLNPAMNKLQLNKLVSDGEIRKLRDTIRKTHLSLTTETEFKIPHLPYT